LLVLSLVLILAIGEGYPNPFTYVMTTNESLLSFSLLAMLAGILLAWKWEGLGGALLLAGYLLWLTVESVSKDEFAFSSSLFVFLFLGVLNIAVWLLTRRSQINQSHPLTAT
jgi:hypothetical protein